MLYPSISKNAILHPGLIPVSGGMAPARWSQVGATNDVEFYISVLFEVSVPPNIYLLSTQHQKRPSFLEKEISKIIKGYTVNCNERGIIQYKLNRTLNLKACKTLFNTTHHQNMSFLAVPTHKMICRYKEFDKTAMRYHIRKYNQMSVTLRRSGMAFA